MFWDIDTTFREAPQILQAMMDNSKCVSQPTTPRPRGDDNRNCCFENLIKETVTSAISNNVEFMEGPVEKANSNQIELQDWLVQLILDSRNESHVPSIIIEPNRTVPHNSFVKPPVFLQRKSRNATDQ